MGTSEATLHISPEELPAPPAARCAILRAPHAASYTIRLDTTRDDVALAAEVAGRVPDVAKELPDVLDRVEHGRAGRQEGDGVRNDQPAREMPAGLVEEEDGMGARRNRGADLGNRRPHRRCVVIRHDQASSLVRFR
jgi:hypothetical protein